jgi:hypothetical protein
VALYINNFKGRSGRTERAKHLRDEFTAIEAAFASLQALNIATYLTIYTNETVLMGIATIAPDNGFLQELTLTADIAIQIASPLNESQYRISLLIHGGDFRVTNLWGAQTWKEYGLGSWFELFTGAGPYASMLLEFYWDICSQSWICVASSKNQFNTLEDGTVQRLYPLLADLTNTEGDDTLGFTRASTGMVWDRTQAHYYLKNDEPRFAGVRYIDNWCATPSDLTTVAWRDTDVTVTTDTGAGPAGEDVQRLAFDVTGGKLSTYILPSFGRAARSADPIKVAVSFKGKAVSGTSAVRVVNAFMGKTALAIPVHDAVHINLTATWDTYGCILDVAKEDNANSSLVLSETNPRTLMEISFMSPSGSAGDDIQITDVQIEVFRGLQPELPSELQDGTIGASMTLSGSGTGTWDNGTKTMTLASAGQFVDFAANLEIGKSYLVHARVTAGDSCDVRLQYEQVFWGAGDVGGDLYLQDAPFVIQHEGGQLKFSLTEGTTSVYLIDIYEMSANHTVVGTENGNSLSDANVLTFASGGPVSSGVLDGVIREVTSENLITFALFRTFTSWSAVGLGSVEPSICKQPVARTEYGLDMWPSRATLIQGGSKVSEGFIQLVFAIPAVIETHDFSLYVRRSIDVSGVQIVTPQHDDVLVDVSPYIDFEAELTGGASGIGGDRVRMKIQDGLLVTNEVTGYASLQVFTYADWHRIDISLDNDGLHDGFRVRVFPASGTTFNASDIDVTTQGWVIVDWAQFELKGGTWPGSSPMVGGETRVTEEFTSALPDGDYYRADNTHVGALTTGTIIWDLEDEVYLNLTYSTTLMIPDILAKNMHEFGLVEFVAQPAPLTVIATSPPYPIEVVDRMNFSANIVSGAMWPIPQESMDVSVTMIFGSITTILLDPIQEPAEELDVTTTMIFGSITQILLTTGPYNDDLDVATTMIYGTLEPKLVTAEKPTEGLEFSISLLSGSMDAA